MLMMYIKYITISAVLKDATTLRFLLEYCGM